MRFFDSARQTFAKIAQTPSIGKRCEVENPRLAGLRKWAVKGFENYLIFYLDGAEIVEIVRILHAARDIPTILAIEE